MNAVYYTQVSFDQPRSHAIRAAERFASLESQPAPGFNYMAKIWSIAVEIARKPSGEFAPTCSAIPHPV